MHKKSSLFVLIFLIPVLSFSQKNDNTASFRSLLSERYFRFNYDNDFFAAKDYYYTQGYSFEVASAQFKRNPISKLLLRSKDTSSISGISLEHIGFTPTSISHDEVLTGDRPFAASLMLKSFNISRNSGSNTQLSSSLSIGMIGPIAFGGPMQRTIHRWIRDEEPKGWQHQISNDIVLNYEVNHEKLVVNSQFATVSSVMQLRAGTLNTKVQTGLSLTAGRYRSVLTGDGRLGKIQLFLYSQPLINVIAYDATLQGGLFSKSSYTLKASEISRLNFQHNFGMVLKTGSLYLEYTRTQLGKEFDSGRRHQWGGFKIGFAI